MDRPFVEHSFPHVGRSFVDIHSLRHIHLRESVDKKYLVCRTLLHKMGHT